MWGGSFVNLIWRTHCVCLFLSVAAGCALVRQQEPIRETGSRISEISSSLGTSWGLEGFHYPEQSEPPQLIQLEPYRPGKIPVVFIHGLASAPGTWKEMFEQLEADEEIRDRFQFWVFQYPTGTSFLTPAAELRRQLTEAIQKHDPAGAETALKHVVLVGHSMGGLVARLQVTDSQDAVWQAFFTRPLEELRTDEATRQQLRQVMVFDPVPNVDRVIFIATPHRGSRWTERPIGFLGRRMVQFPNAVRSKYMELLKSNADKLNDEATQDVPTSVDHLKPGNPLLDALEPLTPSPRVHLHSIVGTGRVQPDLSLGDGVVSLGSSHLDEAESELHVTSSHTKVHKDKAAIKEVRRLLLLHLEELPGRAKIGTLHTPAMIAPAGNQIRDSGDTQLQTP